MPKERKRTEARQDEILRVALQVVDEGGIKALTLRQVADRIGISEAAIFRHFDSKEDIVNAMAEWVFTKCVVPEDDKKGLRDSLLRLMQRQFRSFQDFPQATSVLFQEETFRGFPKAKEMFDRRRRERAERIAAMVREAQKDGEARKDADARVFALIYMGAMRMTVLEWRSAGFSYDLVSKAGPIAEQLWCLLEPGTKAKKKG